MDSVSFLIPTAIIASYVIIFVVYRLYLHPLAKFPGPKICALTSLIELWYDLINHGSYLYKIEEMHERYGAPNITAPRCPGELILLVGSMATDSSMLGPIVRVNPSELSIRDARYYDSLYVTAAVRKTNCWRGNGGMEFRDSHGTTIDHDLHRLRRKPMEPYFSRQGVSLIEPVLQTLVKTMVKRMDSFRATGTVVRLDHVFSAFSGDVITAICIGTNASASLRDSTFDPEWYDLFHDAIHMTPLFRSFPFVPNILTSLPEWLVERMNPALKRLNEWRKMAENHIVQVKTKREKRDSNISFESSINGRNGTLFEQLVSPESRLPESERSIQRLATEAQVLLGAGTVTTTRTLTYLVVHILLNDHVRGKLKEELRDPKADFSRHSPALANLEKLPYLGACIKEGLRLSFGFMVRLPRCSPSVELLYKNWAIPKGTPVGMSAYFMHTDPSVFDEPFQFRPERWLGDQLTPEMQRNYVPFSKGSRACLGANLAHAELMMVVAALFHPHGPQLRLFETSARDVDPVRAYLLPMPALESKGVRIIVE